MHLAKHFLHFSESINTSSSARLIQSVCLSCGRAVLSWGRTCHQWPATSNGHRSFELASSPTGATSASWPICMHQLYSSHEYRIMSCNCNCLLCWVLVKSLLVFYKKYTVQNLISTENVISVLVEKKIIIIILAHNYVLNCSGICDGQFKHIFK